MTVGYLTFLFAVDWTHISFKKYLEFYLGYGYNNEEMPGSSYIAFIIQVLKNLMKVYLVLYSRNEEYFILTFSLHFKEIYTCE